jgi:phosphate-selective porin OprO/OprP
MVHGKFADAYVYQVGVFRDADGAGNDLGNAKAGEYNVTGRLSGRPYMADDGKTFLHLGVAGSLRDFSNDEVRYRARPGIHAAPRFADTGTITGATDGTLIGLEAAYNMGPFCIQGEWAQASIDVEDADDGDFDAFYLQASYWLTGDSNGYSSGKNAFDRPKIKKNYGDGDGVGGWQLAVRYDTIDLEDGDFAEDESFDTWTFGVNWWMNPNTRISMNVVHVDPDRVSEEVDALLMRFQVDF